MKRQKLISILMPFYNEERYITRCIQSIQNQTYTNWELIALDDRSTDSSPDLVKKLSKYDERIRYHLNPDKGVISALKNALEVSNGELISRMDADDYKTDDNLAELAEQLTGEGLLATGLVQYFSEEPDGLQNGYARYEQWLNSVIAEEQCFTHVFKECTIPSPNWLVHRNDLIKAGAFHSVLYPEDYDLCLRFYRAGLKVKSVRKVIHYWRDHSNRVTRNDKRYADNFFLDLKLPYFLETVKNNDTGLILWGAGKKAKEVARRLVADQIPFIWLSNNERKTGHNIYGVRLTSQADYVFQAHHRIILAVSSPNDQNEILSSLNRWNAVAGEHYWWFC